MSIYLDYHASHPMLPEVQQAIVDAVVQFGNPSSVHQYGQKLRHQIEEVRESLADFFGLPDGRVVFTSGATEANNLALHSQTTHEAMLGSFLAASHEHPATLSRIASKNRIAVTSAGQIDLEDLAQKLVRQSTPTLLSLQAANNETSIIQPITQAAMLMHQHHGLLHVDAVQAVGRWDIDMRALGIDMLSVSGHKMGGPAGIGALILPMALPLSPLVMGGGQERGMRGGTENWLGIIGLGAAIAWYRQTEKHSTNLALLDDVMVDGLKMCPNTVWLGYDQPRLAGCALLLTPDQEAQNVLMQLDLAGIAVSSGSACSSGRVGSSHVLQAMGVDDNLAASAIRVSYGRNTKPEDIQHFCTLYRAITGQNHVS